MSQPRNSEGTPFDAGSDADDQLTQTLQRLVNKAHGERQQTSEGVQLLDGETATLKQDGTVVASVTQFYSSGFAARGTVVGNIRLSATEAGSTGDIVVVLPGSWRITSGGSVGSNRQLAGHGYIRRGVGGSFYPVVAIFSDDPGVGPAFISELTLYDATASPMTPVTGALANGDLIDLALCYQRDNPS